MSNIPLTDLKYPCTECGGDATIGYAAHTIREVKIKGNKRLVGMGELNRENEFVSHAQENEV